MSTEPPASSHAHDDERPRKRARSHSPSPPQTAGPILHDPEYFFSDGSTYVLVQRVLFRVHRTILSKDSSAFETMFTLPLPIAQRDAAEGGCEDNPVILQGDTPEQFRSLLWALYAMPHEIMQAGTTQPDWPDFDRFCDVVHIAHKYGFKGLETWALDTFTRWVGPSRHLHAFGALPPTPCPSCELNLGRLRRVLELAALCDHAALRVAVVARLHEELRQPHADLSWFIAIAERFEITPLVGVAYYALMVQGREQWVQLARAGRLSSAQLGKLHNGFYALVSMWQMLRMAAPPIPPCVHMCRPRWGSYWKELMKEDMITAKFPADVIGKLDIAQSRFYTNLRVLDMEQDCRGAAVASVRKLMNDTKETLASHFVDLP